MSKKPKFKPVISRVKLNPEQAVLACSCYTAGKVSTGYTATASAKMCNVSRQAGNKMEMYQSKSSVS